MRRSALLLCWVLGLCSAARAEALRLQCEVSYTPARSTWVRHLDMQWQDDQLISLRIDGVTPYSFAVNAAQLLTAIDNEQIVLDLDALSWQSDFRDKAWGRGQCEALTD